MKRISGHICTRFESIVLPLCPCCFFWQSWYDSDIFWLWSFLLTAFSSLARPPVVTDEWPRRLRSLDLFPVDALCDTPDTSRESRGASMDSQVVEANKRFKNPPKPMVKACLWGILLMRGARFRSSLIYIYIYMLLPPFFRIFRMLYLFH